MASVHGFYHYLVHLSCARGWGLSGKRSEVEKSYEKTCDFVMSFFFDSHIKKGVMSITFNYL